MENILIVKYIILAAFILLAVIYSARRIARTRSRGGSTAVWLLLLRNAMIWVAIGVVALLVYSYRHEFVDIKSRVYANINPGYSYSRGDDFIVEKAEDRHFYLQLRVFNSDDMKQNVDYADIRFIVDTGASFVIISREDLRAAKLEHLVGEQTRLFRTANGIVRLNKLVIPKLTLNKELIFYNLVAYTDAGEGSSPMAGTSLLGLNFLEKFSNYSFQGSKLILTP